MDSNKVIIDIYKNLIGTNKGLLGIAAITGKKFDKQSKFNKRCVGFCIVSAMYITVHDLLLRAQNKKIQELEDEIKELRQMKGE